MSLFTIDLERDLTYEALRQFLRMSDPDELRPQEGPRLDFNEKLPPDLGDVVTAFANTFGGLVLIGIREKKGKQLAIPDEINGLEESRDSIKAKIVNVILSTVQPRPVFAVGVVAVGPTTNRFAAVIRVEEGVYTPYMYIQGQQNRVSVRIGDTNRNAGLEQLKSLFEKGRRGSRQLEEAASDIGDPYVREPMTGTVEGARSPRFQRLIWTPLSQIGIRLDRQAERSFQRLIGTCFPRDRSSSLEVTRSAAYTDFDAPNKEWNYHRKWRASSRGAIGFVSKLGRKRYPAIPQPQAQEIEFLGDWILDAISFLNTARSWAEQHAYLGNAVFVHQISCHRMEQVRFEVSMPTLDLDQYDSMDGVSIPTPISSPPIGWSTQQTLNLSALEDRDVVELLAESFLSHIRDLGGHVDWAKFSKEIAFLMTNFARA